MDAAAPEFTPEQAQRDKRDHDAYLRDYRPQDVLDPESFKHLFQGA